MQIRPLAPSEYDTTRDVHRQAFGPAPDDLWDRRGELLAPLAEQGRVLCADDDGDVVGTAVLYDQTQWWYGRSVPMSGIASLAVAPEARGRGIGRALVDAALRRSAEVGAFLSMLYPTTTPIYRAFGWEHVGALRSVELDAAALRGLATPDSRAVPIRRVGPQDAGEVAATLARLHAAHRDCGPVGWGVDLWRWRLGRSGLDHYLAHDGLLAFGWTGADRGVLEVDRVVAGSEATTRALWSIVGSGSSTASRVVAHVAPHDPVLWLLSERATDTARLRRWMLRLVDAPMAFAARGYPPGVSLEVAFQVVDEQVPGNGGDLLLRVEDGRGRLEPAPPAPDAVRVTAGGLAALYGGIPPDSLRRAGAVDGPAGPLAAVGAALGATAFALDHF